MAGGSTSRCGWRATIVCRVEQLIELALDGVLLRNLCCRRIVNAVEFSYERIWLHVCLAAFGNSNGPRLMAADLEPHWRGAKKDPPLVSSPPSVRTIGVMADLTVKALASGIAAATSS
jgi:hypothetical protein